MDVGQVLHERDDSMQVRSSLNEHPPSALLGHRRDLGRVSACYIVGARSAPAGQVAGLLWEPPGVAQGSTEQEFDLCLRAAQLIAVPADQGVMDGWIKTEQDALALSHGCLRRSAQ